MVTKPKNRIKKKTKTPPKKKKNNKDTKVHKKQQSKQSYNISWQKNSHTNDGFGELLLKNVSPS